MKTLKYFRYFQVTILAIVICGCVQYDNINVTEKPYVNKTSAELYIGEGADDRNQIQLMSSPQDKQYTWTSLDPTVATVTQTGLVTALSEGFSVITVASGNDKTDVDIWVRKWVPLEDLEILGESRIITTRLNKIQIIATPVPLNASEVNIQWTSSDPEAIAVFENGWVVCNDLGNATITAKAGGIEKEVVVQVFQTEKMRKNGWSIPGFNASLSSNPPWFSSQSLDYPLTNMIDDNLATMWHSVYYSQGGRAPCYFIVDLGEEIILTHVSMTRGPNTNGQTGFELLFCAEGGVNNPDDPNTWNWDNQGEFNFDRTIDTEQKYEFSRYPMVRYIKVNMEAKHNPGNFNANFADISVYRGVF